ncbi:MAG TPA: response regulator transcription factor [Dongiaceae bacterium]|jgi:two-component system phosphate regulon response regulator OmpR|nr:response regulator transcription factor [Dongiaceae bacterium]
MSEEEPKHHILVVDDDRRIRELIAKYLDDNGFRVNTAADAAAAREQMRAIAFDLVILDVMMPGMNGLDFTRELRSQSNVPVILLTARGEAEHRIDGLERGADDYLPKPFEPRELILRINAVLRRVTLAEQAEPIVQFGPFVFDIGQRRLMREGNIVELTPAEAAILALLARHANRVVGRDVFGQDSRSLDMHVTRIRRKIEPDPHQPLYLQTVRNQGYVLQNG